ncbi:MAG: class I SAM-dependent methyltransferase [Pseudomonadales bacterium]|nr:class I SAM-dependent methyltransferase [Pseudomonadales bacterium]
MADIDKQKWDKVYSHPQRTFPNPPAALVAYADYLIPGCLLDVACGEGAVALYAAATGLYTTTAIDISQIGLDKLSRFAQQQQLPVNTQAVDLDDLQQLSELGKFHSITLFRFKPSRELLEALILCLVPGGRLLLSTFNMQHHQSTGFSQRFCLQQREFMDIAGSGKLIHYISSDCAPFADTYIFENQQ